MNLSEALPHQQALLAAFATYVQQVGEPDLVAFGQWLALQSKLPDKVDPDTVGYEAHDGLALTAHLANSGHALRFAYYDYLPIRDQCMALLHRLSRFQRMLVRKHLADLPLQSAEEYGLLAGFSGPEPPVWRKSALVQSALLDPPTGTEMVRRLIESGLLLEEPDPEDRRARLLRITPKGQQVLREAHSQMAKAAAELTQHLTDSMLNELMPALRVLNYHHTEAVAGTK